MSDLFASVNGARVVKGAISVPYFGRWIADVSLDATPTLASTGGGITIVFGGLSLVGSLHRAFAYQGALRTRLVGGFAGWSKRVPKKFYKNAAGVKLSLVLGDAARECGERVEIETDRNVGPFFTRMGDEPAARLLTSLAGDVWFTKADGTTRVGSRDGSAIGSHYDIVAPNDGARGVYTIATDTPGDWQPARTFKTADGSVRTIGGVTHSFEGGHVRSEVLVL